MALPSKSDELTRRPSGSADHPTPSAIQSRACDFMRDLKTKDPRRLRRWFSDTSEVWVPPARLVVGVGRILALFRSIFRRYAELEWEVTRFYPVDSSTIIYETVSRGSLKGDDGNTPYRNSIITVMEFDLDGKIKRLSDYFKDTAAFQCSDP